MNLSQSVPVWEKYMLTIDEAAAYFRVGENKLRKLINENVISPTVAQRKISNFVLGSEAGINNKIIVFIYIFAFIIGKFAHFSAKRRWAMP